MKHPAVMLSILCLAALLTGPGPAPLAREVSETFTKEFNALTPPANSSVHSDYLFEQIALGSRYTIQLLDQIKTSTDTNNDRMDQILEKLDILIQQNQEIINRLRKPE